MNGIPNQFCKRGHDLWQDGAVEDFGNGLVRCKACQQRPDTCKRGHDLSKPGARYSNGRCRTCKREENYRTSHPSRDVITRVLQSRCKDCRKMQSYRIERRSIGISAALLCETCLGRRVECIVAKRASHVHGNRRRQEVA